MLRIETVDDRTRVMMFDEQRAAWLIEDRRIALIETGFASDASDLLGGLSYLGLSAEQIDVLALTHIHVDHAGGAGRLARANPRLKVLVHPVGVAHLAAPARMLRSVRRAYGQRFAQVGEILPVPADQIVAVGTGVTIDLGRTRLEVLDTPGHAKHHVIYHDAGTKSVFSGDALGSHYKGLPNLVLTPPADYDGKLAKASVDLIRRLHPRQINFAHCGPRRLNGSDDFFAALIAQHDRWIEAVGRSLELVSQEDDFESLFQAFLDQLPDLRQYPGQFFSFRLSVRGIAQYLKRTA